MEGVATIITLLVSLFFIPGPHEWKAQNSLDCLASIPLSDYAAKLEAAVKMRYLEKVECIGIDPAQSSISK